MFYRNITIKQMEELFDILEGCRGVEQKPEHHPEGDVFVHSVQVLQHALRESDDPHLIFAGMLHDVGKCKGTLGHEEYSCEMLRGKISEKTEWLILNHIRIKWFLNGEMRKLGKVKYLYTHPWFADLILLNRWDNAGRNPNKKIEYDRNKFIDRIFLKVNNECNLR